MKSLTACLALLGLTILPLTRPTPPEDLVRRGNAAFERGTFAEAVALYEQAAERTTDPGLVAFNQAVARYHQALNGEVPGALRQAEEGFRCCLERGDPRRPQALYALGRCLLLRGQEGAGDPAALRSAEEAFARCVNESAGQPALQDDARYSLERTRLLLAQVVQTAAQPEHNPSGEDKEKQPPADSGKDPGASVGEGSKPDPEGSPMPASTDAKQPTTTDASPAPGAGNLPPVPDEADRAVLSPAEAAAHLEQATRRILEEKRAYRLGKVHTPVKGEKDW